ncbi:MAG: hypothetical protein JWM89_729 [Acidimicrobiales bacterium]|nr:hypothetical protein [Acidimicrobiales bacterium]
MIKSMIKAKAEITISGDPDVLAAVHAAVEHHAATSVSAFFERAAQADLDAGRELTEMLDELFEETGGPLTAEEIGAADRDLGCAT